MIRKIAIALASVSLVFIATGCGSQTVPQGETSVETRIAEDKNVPGNIQTEGRIKTAGDTGNP